MNERKIIKFCADNIVQLIETVILVIAVLIPFLIKLSKLFARILVGNSLDLKDMLVYTAIVKGGNIVGAIILFIIAFNIVRRINREFTMNRKNKYHEYSYAWYWYCAKILGINKCNLVLIPVYMQFKLVINSVFNEFPLDSNDYPVVDEKDIKVVKPKDFNDSGEINMILEDRFLISKNQIPVEISELPTIKISRFNEEDQGRYYSPQFMQTVVSEGSKLPYGVTVNLLANTNPMNTKEIANNAFKLASRGNIKHLYVLEQENGPTRNFVCKKYKVY